MDIDEFIADIQNEFAIQNGEREEYLLYSKEEYNMLFMAAVLDVVGESGSNGIAEEEITEQVMAIIRWAERVAVDASMVELYLKGLVEVSVSEKMEEAKPEIRFKLRDEPLDLEELTDGLD